MKLTKSRLQQIIKETLDSALGEDPQEESEGEYHKYPVGALVEVQISDDGYDYDIEKLENEGDFIPTHNMYTSEKFLARIIQVSKREYEEG